MFKPLAKVEGFSRTIFASGLNPDVYRDLNFKYKVEGFAALPVLDGLNPDRLLRSVGIVYTTYSKEGHTVAALFELVGLNPDRPFRRVGMA